MFFLNKAYFAYTNGASSGLCALSVHETSHQWWYGQVGNNQALNPWLDESLATYSELLYYQKLRPSLVDWWWTYRVEPYKPAGSVGSTIYDFQSYRPYVNAVYLRGAQFLDALHSRMGDEAFLAFLHNYVSTYAGRQAAPQDFFNLLHQSTRLDVQPLVDSYFGK
jgi:aminopeptidase N